MVYWQLAYHIMQRNGEQPGRDHTKRLADRCDAHAEAAQMLRHLFGDPIEGVHVAQAAQQALPKHHAEHNPDGGRAQVDGLVQEVDDVQQLQQRHQPDVLELEEGDRCARNEHAELVVDLQPTVLGLVVQPDVREVDQLVLRTRENFWREANFRA